MFHPPAHTYLSLQCLLDSVLYDLRDGDIENDMTQTCTPTCLHICGATEPSTGNSSLSRLTATQRR